MVSVLYTSILRRVVISARQAMTISASKMAGTERKKAACLISIYAVVMQGTSGEKKILANARHRCFAIFVKSPINMIVGIRYAY